jgi:NAD(P)-dependent dehydrogenase (short-subunit alcohol dehydrogenase family)
VSKLYSPAASVDSLILIGGRGRLGQAILTQEAGNSLTQLFATSREGFESPSGVNVQMLDLTDPVSIDSFCSALVEACSDATARVVVAASGFVSQESANNSSKLFDNLSATYVGVVALVQGLLRSRLDLASISFVLAYGAISLDGRRSSAAHVASKAAVASYAVALDRYLQTDSPAINLIYPSTFKKKADSAGIDVDELAYGILERSRRVPRRGVLEWVIPPVQ